MQKQLWMSVLLATAVLAPAVTQAEESDFDFVVNAFPASVFMDASGDKFKVTDSNGSEVGLSEVYFMPNIAMGVGTRYRDVYVDLVGGGGVLINDGFRSYMLQAMIEGGWEASDSLSIGPRLGFVYFVDPEWVEDDSINFDDEPALLLGVELAMGDKIKYIVTVDLINAKFDVADVEAGSQASDDQLDLSGLAIQFGVRGEF